MTAQSHRADYWVYSIAALLIAAALIALIIYETVADKLVAAQSAPLKEPIKTAVQMMLDLSRSFAGWAIALVGATTLIVKSAVEKPGTLNRPQLILTFAILAAGVLSIFFSLLAAERIYEVIFLEQAVQYDERLRTFLRGQYLCGLASIGGFAFLLFQLAWSRLSHAQH